MAGEKAEAALSRAVTDALSQASHQEKKAMKAAQNEMARLQGLLADASGEEAAKLAEQLEAAEAEVEQAKQQTGMTIMRYVAKRWKNATSARVVTSWKISMAKGAQEDKAAQAMAEALSEAASQAQMHEMQHSLGVRVLKMVMSR